MSWLAFAPNVAVAAAILLLPGALLARSIGLRGFRLVASAAPLTVSLVSVAAVFAGWVGVRWSILPVAALTLLAAVCGLAWSRWTPGFRTKDARNAKHILTLLVAVGVGASVIMLSLVRAIGDPSFFSQRYDNFFHLNAVQFVLDTGNASPLSLGLMTSPGGALGFYPSGWHALVALIVQLTGQHVVVATNAAIFAVAGLVWPLGVILLTRTVFGRGWIGTVAAGALSGAFAAFPFLPLHYGVLYPFFLGLACVPVALATAWATFRPGKVVRRQDATLLLVLLVPGLAIAHPGALLALVALSLPIVVGSLVHRISRSTGTRRWLTVGALIVYAIWGVGVLWVLRPPANQIYWPPIESLPHAIGAVVAAAPFGYPWSPVLATLIIVGAYSAIRRPTYARSVALSAGVVGSVLYIVVAGSSIETLRLWLTGPWYNNSPRLASLWVVSAIPLAALGVTCTARFLGRLKAASALRRSARRFPVSAAAVIAVVLVLATQGEAMRQARADIGYTYTLRADAPIVTPDEMALMNDLGRVVPAGAVIAGDPYTGASFAYALSGRPVLMPHLLMDVSPAAQLINTEFSAEGDSPRMCAALAKTGVRYILDFEAGGDFMDNSEDFSGLENLAESPYVALADERGDARLFRITSCGLGS